MNSSPSLGQSTTDRVQFQELQMRPAPKRYAALDFLRAIAITVVLIHHTSIFDTTSTQGTSANVIVFAGWAGVDLFFVLSGFLIGGLLFREYKRSGTISMKRFLIRRGFKIYPPFFFYLFVAGLMKWKSIPHVDFIKQTAIDVLFLNDYLPGTQQHFWSLSVEEHFYILLPLLLLGLIAIKPKSGSPFQKIPLILIALTLSALGLRLLNAYTFHYFQYPYNVFASHLRIDGLFWGVTLAYLYEFHREPLHGFVANRKMSLALCGCALIAPVLMFPQGHAWTVTIGFTLLSAGFSIVVLLAMFSRRLASVKPFGLWSPFYNGAAVLGTYSYSIYLWHPSIAHIAHHYSERLAKVASLSVITLGYFLGSIAIGIVVSRAIEYPSLAFRDRWFPDLNQMTKPASLQA